MTDNKYIAKSYNVICIIYTLWMFPFLSMILYALSDFFSLQFLQPLIDFMKNFVLFLLVRDMVARHYRKKIGDHIYKTHLDWLIRVFWQLFAVVILTILPIGILTENNMNILTPIAALIIVWAYWRVFKGIWLFKKGRPIQNPRAFV